MQEEFKHPRRRKEDCILLQTLFCGKESLRSSMSDVELQVDLAMESSVGGDPALLPESNK
ncbi:Hypothetical protein FKW44_007514 [Caligus rogercresseyi]|uniref:Uncharacterized protein n=1 Tax=Caligus rogercresseyi TaxID=217165 RepID=A0A7T8KEU5_CALRO|nr:Hypothetical protein FKW44_007514 [Caligus rogercresseyi]